MRTSSFMTGVIAGAALGALMVMMFDVDARRPIMQSAGWMREGAGKMGNRMQRMWRRSGQMADRMMPDSFSDMMSGGAH
ncbi:MAG: hypothetical protein ACM3XM_19605 [Mycobacterium leprae]